jgi:hypothetical protein
VENGFKPLLSNATCTATAWHHRSTYLPRVHGVVQHKTTQTSTSEPHQTTQTSAARLPKEVLDAEFELVQQAFFTEPVGGLVSKLAFKCS